MPAVSAASACSSPPSSVIKAGVERWVLETKERREVCPLSHAQRKPLAKAGSVVATPALVPSDAQQWMCAAVSGAVKPKNDTMICIVSAVGSRTTATVPAPGELMGGRQPTGKPPRPPSDADEVIE